MVHDKIVYTYRSKIQTTDTKKPQTIYVYLLNRYDGKEDNKPILTNSNNKVIDVDKKSLKGKLSEQDLLYFPDDNFIVSNLKRNINTYPTGTQVMLKKLESAIHKEVRKANSWEIYTVIKSDTMTSKDLSRILKTSLTSLEKSIIDYLSKTNK